MTIHFLIFTVQISKKSGQRCEPMPGYRPSVEEQWLDRKVTMNQYM